MTIAASGDLLVHTPVAYRALANGRGGYADFRPMLARIRPIVRSADLALCHVETPMGAGAISGYPRFNAPPGLAVGIAWAGWDACSTASNHTLDQGQTGVNTTLGALDRWRVRHTGSARSSREAQRIVHLDAAGLDVAFLAYTYGTNGLPLPHPWSVRMIDLRRIVADGRRARRQGADLVVVNFHWGVEYQHAPSREQIALARAVFRRDAADVIVGQHVHVVQPIRRVRRAHRRLRRGQPALEPDRRLLPDRVTGRADRAPARARRRGEAPAGRGGRLRPDVGAASRLRRRARRVHGGPPAPQRRRRRVPRRRAPALVLAHGAATRA